MTPDELLTIEELAQYLKVRPQTLYPKARRGELPALRVFGQWRFSRRDIDKWLRRCYNSHKDKSKIRRRSQIRYLVKDQP